MVTASAPNWPRFGDEEIAAAYRKVSENVAELKDLERREADAA